MSSVEILPVLGVGVAVFVSTNVDDILLLSAFFSDERLRTRAVVVGQFAGIAVLVVASGICGLAALVVPEGWTALLGVLPVAIGVWKLPPVWRRDGDDAEESRLHERELGVEQRTHSQVLAVTLVTVANGGDNLAVYVPLFAKQPAAIPLYAGVFAVMTGVWCALGYLLVNNRLIGARVRRYGRVALPFVLIVLGLYILSDARALLR